jgi:hypothetical protein
MPQGKKKYADFDQVTAAPSRGRKYTDFDQVTAQSAPPQSLLPDRQEFGRYRMPMTLNESLNLSARFNRGKQAAPQPQTRSLGTAKNLALGAEEEVYGGLVPSALSGLEALGAAMTGDFGPAKEIAELTGRGALKFISAFDPAGNAYEAESAIQDPEIARIQAERQARRQGDPVFGAVDRARQEVEAEAAVDPSLRGRIERGVGRYGTALAPAMVTGALTGGSLPAISAGTAAQSLDAPENMVSNVALGLAPVPAVGGLLRRLKGARAATPEARITAPAEVRPTSRLPEPVYPDAPATQRLRAVSPYTVENAPTTELRAQSPLPLPVRERISEMPEIYAEPVDWANFKVKADLSSARAKAPGATGPRAYDELTFTGGTPLQKAPAGTPKTPPLEVVSALRKAGLLTGVKTHLRNVGGNVAFAGAEEVSRLPASLMDLAISTVSKQRTITGLSPMAMARSAKAAATDGVKEAWSIMRRGATPQQMQALQLGQEINSGNKVLDFYVNTVFRTLGAEDAVFRKFAFTRAVEDRALSMAKTEAKQGLIKSGDIRSRANQLAANPDPALTADAIFDSEIATFNNGNLVGDFLSAGREKIGALPGGKAANFGLDVVFPFTRTPTNIIARMLEYSPVGFGKNAVQVAKAIANKSFTPAEQRAFSQTFGRGVTGSALILLGAKLGAAGLLTGFAETDPSKRNRDVAAGRTPGAIFNPQTGTWHQIAAFTPIGSLLTIGATLQREESRPLKDESNRAANVAAAATQTIAQQPLLIGAKEISEVVTKPGSTGERLGRIAGSFVPTMVSDVGELTDSARREGSGFTAQIQKRVPFARKALPVAVDALGQPLEDRKTAFFDPTLTSTAKDKTSPAMREFVRLDLGISRPQRRPDESEAAHRERSTKFGKEFSALTDQMARSFEYWQLDDQTRREAFVVAKRYLEAKERGEVAEKSADYIIGAARKIVEQRKAKKEAKK